MSVFRKALLFARAPPHKPRFVSLYAGGANPTKTTTTATLGAVAAKSVQGNAGLLEESLLCLTLGPGRGRDVIGMLG